LPVNQDFAAWREKPGFRIVTDRECLTISLVAKAVVRNCIPAGRDYPGMTRKTVAVETDGTFH
jgi:hypothetical protein